jgi:hypothetical protein
MARSDLKKALQELIHNLRIPNVSIAGADSQSAYMDAVNVNIGFRCRRLAICVYLK